MIYPSLWVCVMKRTSVLLLLLAVFAIFSSFANDVVAANDEEATGTASSSASSASGMASNLHSSSAESLARVMSNSQAVSEYVVRVRRELHLIPELMWTEHKTSAVVKRELTNMGVSFTEISKPGVVATIGSGDGPVVALRADMDALPLTEESDIPAERRSQTPGKMHACGHDGHTAMLLGAARVLKAMEVEGNLRGTVRLVFQPAEEGGAGARKMLEAGLSVMKPPIESTFALHNWPYPETPSGSVGTRAGTIMAGSGSFEITLTGAGGHAAAGVPRASIHPFI